MRLSCGVEHRMESLTADVDFGMAVELLKPILQSFPRRKIVFFLTVKAESFCPFFPPIFDFHGRASMIKFLNSLFSVI